MPVDLDWVEAQLQEIRTNGFHKTHVANSNSANTVKSDIAKNLPNAYKDFVANLGGACFYKKGDYYLVAVYFAPYLVFARDGTEFCAIGHCDDSTACFKVDLLNGRESPVFHFRSGNCRRVAGSFFGWLRASCDGAKASFGKGEWEAVVRGPAPFSSSELRIVEARRKFKWQVLSVTEDGTIEVEIQNHSIETLPYLSLAARNKTTGVTGGIWLPTSDINPGDEKIVRHKFLSHLFPLPVTEFTLRPDPSPEDRSRYWEFGRS